MFAIDDVITGALVNVLALAGRRLTIAASDFRNRKYADDLDLARWFNVRQLAQTLPDLSGLPDETAGVQVTVSWSRRPTRRETGWAACWPGRPCCATSALAPSWCHSGVPGLWR